MSQSTRSKRGPEAPRQNPLPGVLSALVVVAIFVALGIMLSNTRPSGSETASSQYSTAETAGEQPATGAGAAASTAETAATQAAAPAESGGAAVADTASRNDKYSSLPPMTIDPAKNYTATITTPRGDIVVKLRPDLAPQTVNSFVFLANEGFYDGLTWHRVLPNFMAQGGDPLGTGTGGPGYNVPAEFTNQVLFDRPGIVAMARAQDPDSAGSQFFITTAPAPFLNEQYTIFGEVVEGQEIVNNIPLRDPEQSPTTPGEQIVKITISEQ